MTTINYDIKYPKNCDMTDYNEERAKFKISEGFRYSQMDDYEDEENYCSCIDEALCNIGANYEWEEYAVRFGYYQGC